MTLKPKILFLYDKSGCCFWRSWQPAQFLQKKGLADVRCIELKTATKQELAEGSKWCDLIQAMGLMGTDGLAMVRRYKELGCKICVDYDDLHYNVSPFNPAYKNFGTEDIEVKDPKTGELTWLWKDGRNGFNIRTNKLRFYGYKGILQEADLITTTTLYLKDAMQEVAEGKANIRVLPNALDLTEWKPLSNVREKYADDFRFGWAVSGSHGEDWLFIKPALLEFMRSHPTAKFVCIGDTYMDIREGLKEVKDQIEWHPFSDLWEYHYPMRMAMLGLDCAIAPLHNLEFNKCKSPLKFAEYTAFGWPVIAQNMIPYSDHIVNGETGLLASDTSSWLSALNSLYQNKDLRTKLRFNAMFTVRDMFDLDKVCREYLDVYRQTISGEVNTIVER